MIKSNNKEIYCYKRFVFQANANKLSSENTEKNMYHAFHNNIKLYNFSKWIKKIK